MNRSSRRINKKKAVPLYFQKSQSSSQFLAAANYKYQIKKLKKVNKELACSLQDVKCRAAAQEKALAEYNQESTQTMFVKMKIKDIVETVKKLVTDLGEVYDVIDGKSFDFLRNCSASHQDARLQICNPSLSTIEESASMSTIEPDLNTEESLHVESSTRSERIGLPAATPFFDADSSRTEIYNVPLALVSEQKLQNVLNGNQSAVARSSKSLERTGSLPSEPGSPPTPQPPDLLPFPLLIESKSSLDISKLKPITTQASLESMRSADRLNQQLITSTSTAKPTISKIPVKKLAASTKDNPHESATPSSHMNRRKTFVVDAKVEKPQISPPVSDQNDAIVLNSLADNAKSDKNYDRRGTFVLNSLTEDSRPDVISDRRGTFVLNSLADDSRSDVISDRRGTFVMNSLTDNKSSDFFDRRGTYFIPTDSKEQSVTSPPKVIETHIPAQSAAPNQTILLCEDMELTEILPLQNQSYQFNPIGASWNEKLETKEPGLNEKLSVRDQPSCATPFVKQFPISKTNVNINSSRQFEVGATHEVVKEAQIHNTVGVKKDGSSKSLVSNILSKTEASVSNQDVNATGLQQKTNKEKDVEKKILKKDDKNVKCSANKLPSPISYYTKPNMSIQNKIFESFSAINTLSDNHKSTVDSASVTETDDCKESTTSKDSLSVKQPAVVKEDAESPKTERRSGRNTNKCFDIFFSESEESEIDIGESFTPKKRFSLKPGRRIINENNNKVFVFKKKSKKQYADKDTPTDSSPDKPEDEDIKNDPEKDIFNFSTSSEAAKSPLIKNKKRKSVMPKSNKHSVSKQSDVGKRLSKTSKRSSKPELNKDEDPVVAVPRKSILCLNKCNSPLPSKKSVQFNRKSVRFTLDEAAPPDKIRDLKCDSLSRENVTPVIPESDDVFDTEKVSLHNTQETQAKRSSIKKKYSSTRPNSLITTGDILKSSSAKSSRSRKRQSSNLNSDSPEDVCESECSPKKKMFQISDETPPQKIETCTNLICEKQEQSKDVKDRFEHSQFISGAISSEVSEENPVGKEKDSVLLNLDANVTAPADKVKKTDLNKVKSPMLSERRSNKKQSLADDFAPVEVHEEKSADNKKEKKSDRILSELPRNLDANLKLSDCMDAIEGTNNNKVKRQFSGVSERRSNKKQSIIDDIFPSLDDAICAEVDKNIETSLKLVEDEPTDCNKGDSVTVKAVQQESRQGKKKSSKKKKTPSKQSKNKENTPKIAEKNFKLDVLSGDNNLCTLLGSKESVENTVKPKNSRKKKESALLLKNDLKADVLNPENSIVSDEAATGRSRRNRTVMSFKEPSLNTKLRRG